LSNPKDEEKAFKVTMADIQQMTEIEKQMQAYDEIPDQPSLLKLDTHISLIDNH